MLRGFCDSVKQAASTFDSAWHKVVDFKPKNRRSAIAVFDKDMMNTSKRCIQNRCVFKTMDTALMLVIERFSGQQFVT